MTPKTKAVQVGDWVNVTDLRDGTQVIACTQVTKLTVEGNKVYASLSEGIAVSTRCLTPATKVAHPKASLPKDRFVINPT